jgi:hypothetical protein
LPRGLGREEEEEKLFPPPQNLFSSPTMMRKRFQLNLINVMFAILRKKRERKTGGEELPSGAEKWKISRVERKKFQLWPLSFHFICLKETIKERFS